ncbi:hypothetical protein [Microvirga aerilata]
MEWFRGTKDQPGLVMSLDRGGQCQGVIFRLPREQPGPYLVVSSCGGYG